MSGNSTLTARSDLRPSWISFTPGLEEIAEKAKEKRYLALCGTNNSGKSTALKGFSLAYGAHKNRFVGVSRFLLDVNFGADRQMLANTSQNSNISFNDQYVNYDGVPVMVEKLFFNLTNSQRDKLLNACSKVLGARFELKFNPDNIMDVPHLLIDGIYLKHTSTGTRLMFRLILELIDPINERVMLDEPELGFAPEVQRRLFYLINDDACRSEYFPHLKAIFVATHSHLFLDKNNISNNFVVKRSDISIKLSQISNVQEMNQLQINLLGNELDTYLLPSAIVVVEGKTDLEIIKRVVSQRYPQRNIIVVSSEGDPSQRVRAFSQMIGGAGTTPYYGRTFVILDSILRGTTPERVYRSGIKAEHVIQWSKNGIEYFYPRDIMKKIFMCSYLELENLNIDNGDEVIINGISLKKTDLSTKVCAMIDAQTEFPSEFNDKFLVPLAAALEN